MKDSARKAMWAKGANKGFGYYIHSKHPLKKSHELGRTHVSKSFNSLEDAIQHAKKLQDGKSVVRIWNGENVINHKITGTIDMHGNFSNSV